MLSRKDYKRFIQGHLIGWVQLHHLHVWLMFMDVYGQILFNVDQMLCMKKAAWKHVPVEIVAPKRQGHPNFGCLVGASPKIPQQIWFGFEVKLPKCLEFFDCRQFFENVSWKFTIRLHTWHDSVFAVHFGPLANQRFTGCWGCSVFSII